MIKLKLKMYNLLRTLEKYVLRNYSIVGSRSVLTTIRKMKIIIRRNSEKGFTTILTKHRDRADLSTYQSPVLLMFYEKNDTCLAFYDFFNLNLNPDKSHEDFLPCLDALIKISKERKVVVQYLGTVEELIAVDVLDDYLSLNHY